MAKNVPKDVQISKTLSYVLRHGAEKEGIQIRKDGFIKIDDLLVNKLFKNATKEEIIKITENCSKKRFLVEYFKENENDEQNSAFIRANQGHSLKNIQVDMDEIIQPDSIHQCLHGTYYKFWESIKIQGLSRMNRQHIHFSEDFPDSKKVISGMRNNCEIAIFINISAAFKDGIKFFRSENNVILSAGDNQGFLRPKYFDKVIDLKKNEELDFEKI